MRAASLRSWIANLADLPGDRGGCGHRDPPWASDPGTEDKEEGATPVKGLPGAAVFGLLPIPPAISTATPCAPAHPGDDGEKPVGNEDLDHSQLAGPRPEDAT